MLLRAARVALRCVSLPLRGDEAALAVLLSLTPAPRVHWAWFPVVIFRRLHFGTIV